MPSLNSLLATVWAIVRWPFAVIYETGENVWAVLTRESPGEVVPPWIWGYITSTAAWVGVQFPRAAGYRATPYEQMTASVGLAIMMILASFGFLTWLAAVMIVPFMIGLARLSPPIDRVWPLANTEGGQPV